MAAALSKSFEFWVCSRRNSKSLASSSSQDFRLSSTRSSLYIQVKFLSLRSPLPKSVAQSGNRRIPDQICSVDEGKNGDGLFATIASSAKRGKWEEGKRCDELILQQDITIRKGSVNVAPMENVGQFQDKGNTPRNILEEIVWNKEAEVTEFKQKLPLKDINEALPTAPPARDFREALKRRAEETNLPALIAEVKKASPSKGVIQPNFDPVRIARSYERGGAACISVLTDSKYFEGSFENLRAIRAAGIKCPLLCKEFIIDAWQIHFARLNGADAVLLVAAVLPDQDLWHMSEICKSLGMVALVEVHNTRELDRVMRIEGIQLIGINNRDLETFKVDINNTMQLLQGEQGERIRRLGIMVVGESGMHSPEDIALVQAAGVCAVLVGESLVRQHAPAEGIAGLFGKDISKKPNEDISLQV
eukprot:c11708_g1_i1 orf=158-1414(-)